MPIILLLLLLADFLTIAIVVFDIHLFREWYLWRDTYGQEDYARRCLYGAIALTAWSLIGRTPLSWLVSKRRPGEDEPEQKHSRRSEKIKRPDGTVINIDFEGESGDPILFVHGWNANSTNWYYQKKHFAGSNRLILIDLPGLGKSTRPNNRDFSLQKMAADLGAVIDHLNLKNVVLWGHSIGGMVILTYCAQVAKADAERRVRGIVLQHTTFTDPLQTSILSRLLVTIEKPILRPICYIMIALSPIFWLSKWMSYMNGNMLLMTRFLTFAGTQTHKQLDFTARLSAMAPPAVFARGMLGMLKTYDVTNDLATLRIPALIFAADSDKLTKPVASEHMHKHIPVSELVTLAPAGHQGLVERHSETNAAAERFIAGLGTASRVDNVSLHSA
jgi:pimeloyl-ACP methyl ester carboxylesterase